MEAFVLHWKSGDKQIIRGNGIADAVRRAGLGGGAFNALDYWEEYDQEEHADLVTTPEKDES